MYHEKMASPEAIVEHLKEVNTLLTEVGYSTRRRAGLLGKSAQTLKQYTVSPDSSQHRQIPSKDLDMLRGTAIDCFWRETPDFLGQWSRAEGWDGPGMMPIKYAVSDAAPMADRDHFFLPRAQELADETGGRVSAPLLRAHGIQLSTKLTPATALRSRWRKAVFALRKKMKPDEIKPILTSVSGHCEYNVMRIGIEFLPFRIPVQEKWVAALEERVAA